MSKLMDSISVRARFARSANLERDLARSEPLDGYVVTARALDVVERMAETAATGTAGRGLVADRSLRFRQIVAGLAHRRRLRRRLRHPASGAQPDRRCFPRGGSTDSRRSPSVRHRDLRLPPGPCDCRAGAAQPHSSLGSVFSRAAQLRRDSLPQGISSFRGSEAGTQGRESDDPKRTGPSPSTLVDIARCLAEDVPLLLVIDEFGKNLEAIRDGGDADPYLLQQLAEAGQGSGLPIFVLTLQHLSFEDHLTGASSNQRREWAKVQGRFEDIAFVESASQSPSSDRHGLRRPRRRTSRPNPPMGQHPGQGNEAVGYC